MIAIQKIDKIPLMVKVEKWGGDSGHVHIVDDIVQSDDRKSVVAKRACGGKYNLLSKNVTIGKKISGVVCKECFGWIGRVDHEDTDQE